MREALYHESVRLSRRVGEGRGGGRVRERRASAGAERRRVGAVVQQHVLAAATEVPRVRVRVRVGG